MAGRLAGTTTIACRTVKLGGITPCSESTLTIQPKARCRVMPTSRLKICFVPPRRKRCRGGWAQSATCSVSSAIPREQVIAAVPAAQHSPPARKVLDRCQCLTVRRRPRRPQRPAVVRGHRLVPRPASRPHTARPYTVRVPLPAVRAGAVRLARPAVRAGAVRLARPAVTGPRSHRWHHRSRPRTSSHPAQCSPVIARR